MKKVLPRVAQKKYETNSNVCTGKENKKLVVQRKMCLKTQNEKATLNVSLRVFGQEFREGPLQKCFVIYSANLTVSLQLSDIPSRPSKSYVM